MFFWLYALIELLALFLDSGIIPTSNSVYPVRKNPVSWPLQTNNTNIISGSQQYTLVS